MLRSQTAQASCLPRPPPHAHTRLLSCPLPCDSSKPRSLLNATQRVRRAHRSSLLPRRGAPPPPLPPPFAPRCIATRRWASPNWQAFDCTCTPCAPLPARGGLGSSARCAREHATSGTEAVATQLEQSEKGRGEKWWCRLQDWGLRVQRAVVEIRQERGGGLATTRCWAMGRRHRDRVLGEMCGSQRCHVTRETKMPTPGGEGRHASTRATRLAPHASKHESEVQIRERSRRAAPKTRLADTRSTSCGEKKGASTRAQTCAQPSSFHPVSRHLVDSSHACER